MLKGSRLQNEQHKKMIAFWLLIFIDDTFAALLYKSN
jgi:hypothetical protein